MLAILATVISITSLDRPIADFAHHHQLRSSLFESMTWGADIMQGYAILLITSSFFRRWRSQLHPIRTTLIITLIFAWITRLTTKYLFGRTWPATWTDNNPSWIKDGIEGFFPLSGSEVYASFPSGHALVTFALAAVFWRYFPKFRWIWRICGISVVIGMLGQYYHFLGDLLAGAVLGCACGQLSMALIALYQSKKTLVGRNRQTRKIR